MRRILISLVFVAAVVFVAQNYYSNNPKQQSFSSTQLRLPATLIDFPKPPEKMWNIQSVDTMKYSRDLARKKSKDLEFLEEIDNQIKNISATGATHVAIGTPYDKEFVPMIEKWVSAARKYNLNVWFRGNWSGWEGWFDYPKNMTRQEHIEKTKDFIIQNQNIFSDGDIFSACPECENGGTGDPRKTGDVDGFREFIISEYQSISEVFEKINKKVLSNYYPMNGDVARLIMNKETTEAMDGIIVIDHYVKSPDRLVKDIKNLQEKTGGKIVLGEFGAPIPDIHGKMTESQQAEWIKDVFKKISVVEGVQGINYWVNIGGTTGIWDKNGKELPAVSVLRKYFKVKTVFGVVTDDLNYPISGARISYSSEEVFSGENGYFEIRYTENFPLNIIVSSNELLDKYIEVKNNINLIHIIMNKK